MAYPTSVIQIIDINGNPVDITVYNKIGMMQKIDIINKIADLSKIDTPEFQPDTFGWITHILKAIIKSPKKYADDPNLIVELDETDIMPLLQFIGQHYSLAGFLDHLSKAFPKSN